MGMDCEGAAKAVEQAKSTAAPDPLAILGLEGHLRGCPACAARYAALLPFLRRDSGGEFFTGPAPAESATVRSVMARLPLAPPRLPRARFRPAFAFAAAAALAILFGLGVLKAAGTVEVRFALYAPEARSVLLAADFTSWGESAHEMKRTEEPGVWEVRIRLRRSRSYLYNFVVDGEAWIPDPRADVILDDGFGNKSSLLSI